MRTAKRVTLEQGQVRYWCLTCKCKKEYLVARNGQGCWLFTLDHNHGVSQQKIEVLIKGRYYRPKFISIVAA